MSMTSKPLFVPFILLIGSILSPGISTAFPGDVLLALPSPSPLPSGLEYINGELFLADMKNGLIYRVHPESGEVIGSFASPGAMPSGLAWDGEHLWCIDRKSEKVYCIDLARNMVVKEIPSPCSSPSGLAFDNKNLWTSDPWNDELHIFSRSDGTSLKRLPSPSREPAGLTFDSRYIWVSDRVDNELYMVDPGNGEVINSFPSPGEYPWGMAWDGKDLFNVDYQDKRLFKVVRMDRERVKVSAPRREKIEFIQEVRNFGPDPLDSVEIFIAIPPPLASQTFIEKPRFDPEPKEVKKDRWGQDFALFAFKDVKPGATLRTALQLRATLFSSKYFIYPERCKSMGNIPEKIRREYLRDGEKLDIFHPSIRKAALKLSRGEKNPCLLMRKVYDFVLSRMEYKLEGGWNSAPLLLERGTGSCSEYTFLFISLLRAAGIPARYAGSVVMRKDESSFDDIYHRWAEVFLPGYGWIPVDPSRGDKKTPAERFRAIGHLSNDALITTLSGGGSEFLDWTYNSNVRYQYKGRARVEVESIAHWEPDKER